MDETGDGGVGAWWDDLSGAWGGDSSSVIIDSAPIEVAVDVPEIGTPLPSPVAGGTDLLGVFERAGNLGLNAVKTFEGLGLARKAQQSDAAIAQSRIATQATVAQAQLAAQRGNATADQQIAQLGANARVAAAKVKSLLSNPVVLAGAAVLALAGLHFAAARSR